MNTFVKDGKPKYATKPAEMPKIRTVPIDEALTEASELISQSFLYCENGKMCWERLHRTAFFLLRRDRMVQLFAVIYFGYRAIRLFSRNGRCQLYYSNVRMWHCHGRRSKRTLRRGRIFGNHLLVVSMGLFSRYKGTTDHHYTNFICVICAGCVGIIG